MPSGADNLCGSLGWVTCTFRCLPHRPHVNKMGGNLYATQLYIQIIHREKLQGYIASIESHLKQSLNFGI